MGSLTNAAAGTAVPAGRSLAPVRYHRGHDGTPDLGVEPGRGVVARIAYLERTEAARAGVEQGAPGPVSVRHGSSRRLGSNRTGRFYESPAGRSVVSTSSSATPHGGHIGAEIDAHLVESVVKGRIEAPLRH